MVSKRKGKKINGWIIVDKPAGITSTGVVNRIKWAFNAKKVGHSGTLDPDATGVLPIALGEATKTIPYIMDELKSYQFCVKFGEATDTDDATGKIIQTSNKRPLDDQISAMLSKYTGLIKQTPPNFSAIKINGSRAYDLAREGLELKLNPRPLFVKELKFLERSDDEHALFQLTCGKGGYVRSIARDLGNDLNCYGHVKWLKRVWTGPFKIESCITIDKVQELYKSPKLLQILQPLELGLQNLPFVSCSAKELGDIANGRAVKVNSNDIKPEEKCWIQCEGKALALGYLKKSIFYPSRVFNMEN
jgi:tRNA pseudouridine55 synthase